MTQLVRKRPVREPRAWQDGDEWLAIPSHVFRVDRPGNWERLWRVKLPGEPVRSFSDRQYGSPRASFVAACSWRAEREPSPWARGFVNRDERVDKLRPTGMPGVHCYPNRRRGRTVGWIVELRVGSTTGPHGRHIERRYLPVTATEGDLWEAIEWARERRRELLQAGA